MNPKREAANESKTPQTPISPSHHLFQGES